MFFQSKKNPYGAKENQEDVERDFYKSFGQDNEDKEVEVEVEVEEEEKEEVVFK